MTTTALEPRQINVWKREPTLRELIVWVALSCVLFDVMANVLTGWHALVFSYGDNLAYLQVAQAIRNWNFHGLGIQHFMGYPYTIAAISLLFHLPLDLKLSLVAGVASLASTLIVARLFGTWVAAYFAFTNLAWLQLSFLGGSEPLAVALGLAAFWSFRRDHVLSAAFLASLATTVRPLMFAALVGIGIALLIQKRYAKFLGALGVGLVIGLLYMWPLARYFGDPLATVHSYTSRDYGGGGMAGPHGHLFGWPFHGIIAGTVAYPAPWTNLIESFVWIALVVLGTLTMFRTSYRRYARAHPAEAIFAGLFIYAIFSYDYLIWARSAFMRFSIPVIPFVFSALMKWLPRDRRILLPLATAATLLAVYSAVGIKNVFHFLR
jgi:hypothetical protein